MQAPACTSSSSLTNPDVLPLSFESHQPASTSPSSSSLTSLCFQPTSKEIQASASTPSSGFVYDVAAMQATNLLHLAHQNPALLRMWADRMVEGVPRGRRDCLDLAGKLPLCWKALDAGIDSSMLMIDCAQAGGVYGGGDGSLVGKHGSLEPIEIKGCIRRRGKKQAFSFRNIRCGAGSDWRHLFLVGRTHNPRSWQSVADVEGAAWLGYVGRDAFERALLASGRDLDSPALASVSPGSVAGWLGRQVVWVRLAELSLDWWRNHVLQC
jgi:hypothetical protein